MSEKLNNLLGKTSRPYHFFMCLVPSKDRDQDIHRRTIDDFLHSDGILGYIRQHVVHVTHSIILDDKWFVESSLVYQWKRRQHKLLFHLIFQHFKKIIGKSSNLGLVSERDNRLRTLTYDLNNVGKRFKKFLQLCVTVVSNSALLPEVVVIPGYELVERDLTPRHRLQHIHYLSGEGNELASQSRRRTYQVTLLDDQILRRGLGDLLDTSCSSNYQNTLYSLDKML